MLDAKSALLKVLDEDGLISLVVDDVLDGVVKAKLEELVQSSDNSLDDALLAMIYPVIREEANKFLLAKKAELLA